MIFFELIIYSKFIYLHFSCSLVNCVFSFFKRVLLKTSFRSFSFRKQKYYVIGFLLVVYA